jgi:phosphate-selective porin OprO/OprP
MNWNRNFPLVLVAFTSLAVQAAALNEGETSPGLQTEQTPAAKAPEPDGTIKTFWKDGFRFEAADKSFRAKLGGRLFFDTGFISTDDNYESAFGREEDGSKFRAARIYMEGEIDESVEYKWQYDMAGGTNNKFKDVYIGFKDTPVGTLRVGQFKEPFSLEELTSSNYITFMERAAPNKLVPGRNIGVAVLDHSKSKRVTWSGARLEHSANDRDRYLR